MTRRWNSAALPLQPVEPLPARNLPGLAHFRGQVENQGQVGHQAVGRGPVGRKDHLRRQTSTRHLVGLGGQAKRSEITTRPAASAGRMTVCTRSARAAR